MPGTKAGGQKARQKNLERDPNFYKKIGSLGGRATGYKGFAANPELAKRAGSKGGKISRRTSAPAEPKVYYYEDERTIYSEPKIIKPKVSDPEPKNASSNVWLSWFRRNRK